MRSNGQEVQKQPLKQNQDFAWFFKMLFLIGIVGTFLAVGGGGVVVWYFSKDLPQIITVADYRPLGVTRILGGGGKEEQELGDFYLERRYLIPYDKIPDHVVKAFVAAEDDKFFEHPGINIASIIRAGIANFRAGHVVQGGSTITQQVAKSLLLTSQRTFDRKIREVILASRIERNLTKQQILYLYLNQIYLGHRAYGIQAASKAYFRKDISKITIAEAALLAGMPQAPGKYSPLLNPKRAKERQNYVLRRMFENRFISQGEMNKAMSEPVKVFKDWDPNSEFAPYFVEFLRKYLVEKYGEKAVLQEGLTVSVPMTRETALTASKAVRTGLLALDKRIGYRGPVKNLSTSDQIEKFLSEYRLKMIEKKLSFQLFLPDGRLDPVQGMHEAGISSDVGLLEPGELYQAVVLGADADQKSARVMIGAVKGDLPLSLMKWARPLRDERNPAAIRPEPTAVSKWFKKGDVIWVSLADSTAEQSLPSKGAKGSKEFKESKESKETHVTVKLEQEPNVQGALFSMDVQTGDVLAMVGGYNFDTSEFNRSVQAMRQPGSAFKPVIYASALEKGYTPATIIVDSPIVFKDSDGSGAWKPSNYEEKFYGDTTFRQALIKSRNIPTVKIVQSVQVPYLIDYARRLGMTGQFNQDLSISLGSATSNLLEMTRVYALFPRLGRKVNPRFLIKVEDRDGKVLEQTVPDQAPALTKLPQAQTLNPEGAPVNTQVGGEAPPQGGENTATSQTPPVKSVLGKVLFPDYPLASDPAQVIDPRIAYVMTNLMKEVVTFGTGHEAKNLNRPAAGKTGTTNESIDAWFIGFTPQVVTGVWTGFDNQKTLGAGETGARAALPIWLSFMQEAVKPYPPEDFAIPSGIVFSNINPNTGRLASAGSTLAIKEAFIEGTQPSLSGEGSFSAGSSSNSGSEEDDAQSYFQEDRE